MSITNQRLFVGHIICSQAHALTVPTTAHVFSVHAHKLPGRDRQTYAHIVVLRPAIFTTTYAAIAIYDADAKCTWGMCYVEF